MKILRVEIPDRVYCQIETLVKQGWFTSPEDVVDQALRKFLEAHRPELMEKFIREDVEWGLRGTT